MINHDNNFNQRRPQANSARVPRLKVTKIGIVSRDYRDKYRNGFRDFSEVMSRVLALLDEEHCDTVLFSLFSIIPRSSFSPLMHLRHLRHIKSVHYEEFTGWRFTKGKWKKTSNKANGRYVVLHRRSSGWREYAFSQTFGSLSPLTKNNKQIISDFVRDEMPKRVLGNCCILLCGESNGVRYRRRDGKVHDDFHLREAIPQSVTIVLNPVHDRMTRFEMRLKRRFLSENGRWVISVWNKGKADRSGRIRDGKSPAWNLFHNGQEMTMTIKPTPNELALEIGIIDVRKG